MKTQIPALTSLRFIAAMCIFTVHLLGHYVSYEDASYGPFLIKFASFGMTTFFVLSGFVIHWNYHDQLSQKKNYHIFNYIISRIARIYPLYLVMVFFCLAINADCSKFLIYLPYYLTLSQSWYPVFFEGATHNIFAMSLIGCAWSLSTEMFLYLIYIPFSLFIISINKMKTLALSFFSIFLLGYILFYIFFYMIPEYTITKIWVQLFLTRLPEFFIGCLVSQYILIKEKEENYWVKILLFFGAIFYLLFIYSYDDSFWKMIATGFILSPGIAALIYLICSSNALIFKKIFENRFVLLLGDASYSIYMLHIFFLFVPRVHGIDLYWRLFIQILFVFLISIGIYKGFEIPMRKLIRTRFSIKKPNEIHPSVELGYSPQHP
ncbi:MAG: acyltransferase [Proteobacteria bacterium]|nr:acyltransferase [Pseudomonadota bacterium]